MNIRHPAEQFYIIPVPKEMNNIRHPEFGGAFPAGFQQFAFPGKKYLQLRYGLPQYGDLPQQKQVVFTRNKLRRVQNNKIRIPKTKRFADLVFFRPADRMKPL
jgi:hypothetical protein